MKKIKVKSGGCGIRRTDAKGNVRFELKTAEHGPFKCDDTQADRLVKLGVAEYISEEPEPETISGHLDVAQLENMTNAQLKNLADDFGLDTSGCKKKADFVDVIMAAEVEADADDEGDELTDSDLDTEDESEEPEAEADTEEADGDELPPLDAADPE